MKSSRDSFIVLFRVNINPTTQLAADRILYLFYVMSDAVPIWVHADEIP